MIVERHLCMSGKTLGRLSGGQECLDLAVAQHDGMVFEHRACGLYGDDPAGAEEERFAYRGVPWISTTTRRFGERHAMRSLRCFWSGQDLTGSVLPKPKVSTLLASTPLETR